MENQDQKIKELQKKLADEKNRQSIENDNGPYKCNECGNRVSYTFIMKFIRDSGLCPDCAIKDE